MFFMRNTPFNGIVMELQADVFTTSTGGFFIFYFLNGQTRCMQQASMMAKTSVTLSVCYRNQAGEGF